MKKYIYYIENTVNESRSKISGYFDNAQDASEALKNCEDWYRPKGTGKIYRVELGLCNQPELVYENR